MKLKTQKQEASTKEKIVNCAFDLFSKKGIKDISMRAIAQAAGVTKPVIYYYFKDKDDLCFEIITNFTRAEQERLQGFAKNSKSLSALLEKLFAAYLDNAKNKKIVGFMMHMHGYVPTHKNMEARLKKLHSSKQDVLKEILGAEVKAGRIKQARADIAKHFIIANIMHMVLRPEGCHGAFGPKYPKEIASAILRAIEYNGESK